MRYRSLGHTGIRVSEIGFGTWGLGGTRDGAIAYGPTNDRESIAALERAFERGINFYDTADLYGHGHAEELLGETFATRRSKIVIATKAGFRDARTQEFTPQYLESALEGSLRRLRCDAIDLFLLHSPSLEILERRPEVWETAERLRGRGTARAIGVSVRSPDDGLAVVAQFAPDVLEVNFNLTDQRAVQNGLFDRCQHQGIGIIVRTPLCFGFLTGAYAADQRFASGDHRAGWSVEQRRRWNEANQLFADAVARVPGQTAAQFALRYCLSYPAVSTAIPGMLQTEHVDENTRASELGPMSSEEIDRIAEAYRQHTFFLPGGAVA